MKQTKLWLTTIAALLCSLTASAETITFADWTSTNKSHGSTSSKTYTFTAKEGAMLSFDWWVSSESGYDELIVTLDGTTILEKSGGQRGTYGNAISKGSHTLVVKYTKDGSNSSGSDQASVSDIVITMPDVIDGLRYSTSDTIASVIDAIDAVAIAIPSSVTIDGNVYVVKAIGNNAFYGCSSLTSITIPESVTSIGNSAFDNCSGLKEVIFEDGEEALTLGYNASSQGLFYDCPLESVYMGRNLSYNSGKSYGYSPFYNKTKLATLTIGNSVTSIGYYAFYGCSTLTSITIPESVTGIGDYAFDNCTSLKEVIFEDGSETLTLGYNYYYSSGTGQGLFYDCPLESVYLGRNLIYISSGSYGYSPFYKSGRYPTISLGEGITSISALLFYGNSRLTSITIPESVTSIGSEAFYACTSLTSITIPESVTSIGGGAFSGCSSLTSITIPEGVTSIRSSAFYGCSSLTSITIPESVTSIGSSAFYGCSSLTSITIPESVTSIGSSAFYDCSGLTSITIPESVTSIGAYAFSGCSKLYKVFNKSDLLFTKGSSNYGNVAYYAKVLWQEGHFTTVGDFLFHTANGVHSLVDYIGEDTEIVFPDKYNGESYNIGGYALYNCSNLHSVTIGSGVLSIGSNNFSTPQKVIWLANTPPTGYANAKGSINYVANEQYTNLSNAKVYPYLSSMFEVDGVKYVPVSPSERTCHAIDCVYDDEAATINVGETASFNGVAMKVTEVMPYTFYGNNHIKEVSVSHLGDIGDYAFYDCDTIETVNVSNQGGIGNQAFYDCNGIKSIDIRNQGTIGNQAFYGCNGMETVIVANYIPTAPSVDDTPLTFADWTSTNHSSSSTSSEAYTFTAGKGATLSFSWSVSSEASYDKLIVTLDGTTILEKSGSQSGTYSNAISKGSHTLVVKYTKDSSDSSGYDQAKVSNITVSKGGATTLVVGVGSEAFSGCSSLKTVTLGDSIGSLGDEAFYQCSSLQEIVIPDSVKSVGSYCFSGCSAMKSAVIGDGVANVQGYTFQNCTALANVTVGDGVTTISNYAFTGCPALTNVALGRSVATIGNYTFQNCSSLPEITLPQAVTKVGDYVFAGCSKLSDVIIEDRTTALELGSNGSSALFADCPLDSVYIGGKITYNTTSSKGYSLFYRNTSLRSVVITDREEQVYDNEFYGCTNLKNVTIGNGVKSIGDYAFSGCSSLDGFSFGSNMESIGAEAFSDCTNLTSITSHAAVPPTCGTQALDDINKWNCVLRVPSGYTAAYQAAEQWKEFFFIEDVVEVEQYILTYVVDGEVYHTDTLAHKAAIVQPETPVKEGYTFSGWSEAPETMPAEDVTISGTFTVNKYLVTFKIGDEVIAADSLEYGAAIVAPEAPEKDGYTFNGWGEVAETVPANDVTYEGSYSVNSYLLTYTIDGETVQSDSVPYGTAITLLEEPTKVGYTFSGWSEAPETMPAEDVTISGTFTINKYLVTFKIGDEVIAADSLEYGAAIVAPEAPEKEGHTFNGWGEVVETVPASDLTYEGTYTVNIYKVYYYVGEELVHTAEVAYGEVIPEYIYEPTGEGDVFEGWIGETYETMPAHDVTYTANITNGIGQLTNDNGQLIIYNLMGRKVLNTENLRGGIYIVNGKKVVIK